MELYYNRCIRYLQTIKMNDLPTDTVVKVVGVGLFFVGIRLFRQKIMMSLFGTYSHCRGMYKQITFTKPFVPLYLTAENIEKPHMISLWLMNVNNVELFGYQHTEMDETISRGIEKFKIGFDPSHHEKKYEINLWQIAKEQYDEIYLGQKDFPAKIVIHLSPETLLFTKIPIQYEKDYSIVLSATTTNQITFM
jgi:hypothetical protein